MQDLPAKKAKKIKKKSHKKNKHKQVSILYKYSVPFVLQQFNILPDSLFHPRIANLLQFCSSSIKQQSFFVQKISKPPFGSTYETTSIDAFWSIKLSLELTKAIVKIRKIRMLFKRLLHKWRVSRITPSNTEDIATLQSPQYPIYIIDWKIRAKYVFEASTLAKDMMERLLCHDGFWEDPQPPRNPYTNLQLSLAQNISIYQQLSRAPIQLGWAVLAFRQVSYDIGRFLLEYRTPIQLHSYRTTMRNPLHVDYRDRLLDFIEYAYDQESVDCFTVTYSYCIQHFPSNPILKAWANLCFTFYEAPLLYSKHAEGLQKVQDSILCKTIYLLPKQEDLRMLRLMHLRLQ